MSTRARPSALRIRAGIFRRAESRQVADLVGPSQDLGEPGGCAGREAVEDPLVKGPHREVVDQRRRHDRLEIAAEVVGILPDHGAGDVESSVDGIAIHHGGVQQSHGFQGAADDVLGLLDGDGLVDVRPEQDLLQLVGDHAHGERIRREGGRPGADEGVGR